MNAEGAREGAHRPNRQPEPREYQSATAEGWTTADAAELDVLIYELARGYLEHRANCASCAAEYPPCAHVRRAIESVLEWREARELMSRAEWLRAERDRIGGRAA